MNDKEKKAIEKIEKHILIGECEKAIGVPIYISDLKTVLNLLETQKAEIEKKDKEISKLKNNNKDLLRKLRNRVKEVKKLEKYSTYKKEFSTLNKQLKKKDKIIDLMANSFAEEGFYSEHCQTLIDNDICPDDCNKCIKQYFERKVEESK